jgi:hypothetical protein
MRTVVLILFITTIARTAVNAQEFSIKRLELDGDKVNLYYDLLDSIKGRTYTIDLYSSKDNFVSRLEKVSGDIGLEVKPGSNHKLTWNAKEELGSAFDGKVGFEVRGHVYIPFVRLEGLNKVYKRGKDYPFTWRGGTQQNILNFDLYNGDEKIYPFSNIANVGQTTINLPTSVKPGKNYYFKITDTKNKDQIVNSSYFSVKRKVPFLLKVIPFAAAIGISYNAILDKNENQDIPDPLNPTTIKN